MTSEKFLRELQQRFPHSPTEAQEKWFPLIASYLCSRTPQTAFLLTGYAGTGKTTLIGFLVHQLKHIQYKAVLMAPTGRAAKVMATYSNSPSYTIHKQIYFPKAQAAGGLKFELKPNKFKRTLFIIDEASMIGDDYQQAKLFENGSLLDDVIQYVSQGVDCKLMFVGDSAQLPPVKLDISPALDPIRLEQNYFDKVIHVGLDGVVRQSKTSGILFNATELRFQLNLGVFDQFKFKVKGFPDIFYTNNGMDLFEAIEEAFQRSGTGQTVFIVRSNKRANQFNAHIRSRILDLEQELSVGDELMVVKNNYFWLSSERASGFIANGDVIAIDAIKRYKSLYGYSFAEVTVRMVDYPDEAPFETVLLLDTLRSETASLSQTQANDLYNRVLEDYADEKSKYKRFLKVKNNPFFNALQVKYSYAVTCHKSQGGQWENVFVEKPYLPEGPNKDYFRWLYTAITRTKERLYLIGFPDGDFEELE